MRRVEESEERRRATVQDTLSIEVAVSGFLHRVTWLVCRHFFQSGTARESISVEHFGAVWGPEMRWLQFLGR